MNLSTYVMLGFNLLELNANVLYFTKYHRVLNTHCLTLVQFQDKFKMVMKKYDLSLNCSKIKQEWSNVEC